MSKRKVSLDELLKCPICLGHLHAACLSRCGHSFCLECINHSLKSSSTCPICRSKLQSCDVYPNPLLNQLLQREESKETDLVDSIRNIIQQVYASNPTGISLEIMLEAMEKPLLDNLKRVIAEKDDDALLRYFLKSAIHLKKENIIQMRSDLEILEQDYRLCQNPLQVGSMSCGYSKSQERISDHLKDLEDLYFRYKKSKSDSWVGLSDFSRDLENFSGISRFKTCAVLHYADNFFNYASSIVSSIEFDKDDEYFAIAGVTKKIRIFEYADVVRDYGNRSNNFITQTRQGQDDEVYMMHLWQVVNNVLRTDTEFDQDDQVPRYPIREMACSSKISCLSWSFVEKSHLACSDYEGCVTLWDSSTGTAVLQYDEHEKRAWSVDFSESDPLKLASGGDDSKVKIWTTNRKQSVLTIESKANVCSVKFNPSNSNFIAFGSADHHVHYYDLRNLKEPLHVFRGHKKAASYVKYISPNEIVSASTDCTLKMWSIEGSVSTQISENIRSFTGHTNEKNFVGLSVNSSGDFIACGSETNEVYLYQSKLSNPIITHKFGNNIDSISGEEMREEDPSQFVSSLCFKRKDPNILLAANSQGKIKVLEMV